MTNVSRRPAWAGFHKRRRMLCIFLWFIVCDSAKVTFCSAITPRSQHASETANNPNTGSSEVPSFSVKSSHFSYYKNPKSDESVLQRISRAVPRPKVTEHSLESISKNDINSDFVLKIPLSILRQREFYRLLRPLRGEEKQVKSIKKRSTIIPTLRFGRSDDENVLNTLMGEDESISKRSDTIIPTIRFGRANNEYDEKSPNSVIPYPRFGRSFETRKENKINDYTDEISNKYYTEDADNYMLSEDKNDNNQYGDSFQDPLDSELMHKRDIEDYNTIIPYPRPGREASENELFERKLKKVDPDYILPQIRYGRSMLLLSPPKTEDTTKQKPTHTFVLPYPRPGRSNKDAKFEKSNNEQFVLPYPRPGRSAVYEVNTKRPKLLKSSKGYMLPSARLGRTAFNSYFESDDDNIEIEDGFLGLKFNPLFLKSQQKNLSEKPSDKTESNSVFVIPYPRPGKKSSFTIKSETQSPNNAVGGVIEYVLPYPRPGKKSDRQQLSEISQSEISQNQNFIVPYPRPGRSIKNSFKDVVVLKDESYSKENVDEIFESEENEYKSLIDLHDSYLTLSKKPDTTSLLNYGRFDKRSGSLVPYPRPGRFVDASINAHAFSQYPNINLDGLDYESLVLNIDSNADQNSDQLRFKRSTTVVPYPRLGRSSSTLRLKKSNTVLPYPRFGRSTSATSHPLPKRSNSIVPYPRFGRFISNDPYSRVRKGNLVAPDPTADRSESEVPYPRLGRSEALVPYPRPGRSESVVPYPRPGRAEFAAPFSKSGRSGAIVPYPRPGRSGAIVPYPRPGRSGSVVPYPRPGRSGSVVPYPRPGRSGAVLPYPRPGRSGSVVPYPRPGRSEAVVPYQRLRRSVSVVPYPRPGRSGSIVPYPRPGRSGSVVPYPRPGRSDSTDSIVPYSRLVHTSPEQTNFDEYTKTENEHLSDLISGHSNLKRDDNYIVPYPRSGRSDDQSSMNRRTEFGHESSKKDISDSKRNRPTPGQGYVLPHPRIGRSESENSNRETTDADTVIPYPRLGRSQNQVTPSPDAINSIHKLNKHMIPNVDDSVYLLPYPRPGRYSEETFEL